MKEVKTREQVLEELRRIFTGSESQNLSSEGEGMPSSNSEKGAASPSARETTECKRFDEDLPQRAKRFRTIVELAPFPISVIDASNRYIYVNQKFVDLFGYTLADIPNGKEWFRLAFPDTEYRRQAILAWLSDLAKSKKHEARPREFSVQCKDGKRLDILFRSMTMEDGEQCITYEDLTERKKAQEQMLKRLRKALGGAIQAIALTVEKRDAYTAGHQRRMADLARAIATELGLSRYKIDGIRMAGVIHDLGKIGVPSEILSKPGRLSDIEFNLIKTHAQIGYDILKEIDFPWPVASMVLQHHEKVNGSGYPQGLSGDNILLEAKILTVADVVEAMSSHRPYRPALGIKSALEEISGNKGTLYDATVVEACCNLFAKKGFTWK